MRVDHWNAFVHGGAAIAARRLHHALLIKGVASRFWCSKATKEVAHDPSYAVPAWMTGGRTGVGGKLTKLWRQHQKSSFSRRWRRSLGPPRMDRETFSPPTAGVLTPVSSWGDVVHLHWIADWADFPSFFASLPDHVPLVWTLHDVWPFTGGCHYSSGCEAFIDQCQHCPQIGRPGEYDLAHHGFHIKRRAFAGKNLHVVGASHWVEQEARRSALFGAAHSFRTIHYGLDVDAFCPMDRRVARRRIQAPEDAFIVAFGAESMDKPRKGIRELLQALSQVNVNRQTQHSRPSRSPVVGLAFGGGNLPQTESLPEILRMGFVHDRQLQRTVYSAADLFVLPSLEDNLPQTGLEALACGVPIVAFDAGGVGDFVRDGHTGLLAAKGNVDELTQAITWMADHPQQRRRMGENARQLITAEFEQQTQAQKYIELYRELMSQMNRFAA